jgi:hypothetical protein
VPRCGSTGVDHHQSISMHGMVHPLLLPPAGHRAGPRGIS